MPFQLRTRDMKHGVRGIVSSARRGVSAEEDADCPDDNFSRPWQKAATPSAMERNSAGRVSQLELRFREQLRSAVRSTGGSGTVSSGIHGRRTPSLRELPHKVLGVILESESRNVEIQGGGRGSTSEATVPVVVGVGVARTSGRERCKLNSRGTVNAWAELIRHTRRLQGLATEASSSLADAGGSLNPPLNRLH